MPWPDKFSSYVVDHYLLTELRGTVDGVVFKGFDFDNVAPAFVPGNLVKVVFSPHIWCGDSGMLGAKSTVISAKASLRLDIIRFELIKRSYRQVTVSVGGTSHTAEELIDSDID